MWDEATGSNQVPTAIDEIVEGIAIAGDIIVEHTDAVARDDLPP